MLFSGRLGAAIDFRGQTGLFSALADAIHVVPATLTLDQAMYIGLETRESRVEFAGKLQVTANCLVKTFARNQQGNTRRIRR